MYLPTKIVEKNKRKSKEHQLTQGTKVQSSPESLQYI